MMELISCMCPTRGNPLFVRRAIENFLKQDYPNRELVFVTTNPHAAIPISDPRIRHFFIDASQMPEKHMPIGQQRNVCLDLCQGTFVAVWDDDDFYSPDRLSHSLGEMARTQKPAFILHAETLLSEEGEAYVHDTRMWENSFVSRKDALDQVRYPTVQIAEDLQMVANFCRKWGKPVLSRRHEMYVYVQQPQGTTSAHPHHITNRTWKYNLSVSKRLPPEEAQRILQLCGATR